ncbi:hypothetical protein [Corynebacterium comes]|uniref:Uncharacterized protein n=1 Tax=Corynebacterium comes TaxID=2675218 RepID=A0A6B8W1F7_9CORY|nr:hypothetical protein [Corynebacterium comes]QGU05235.1 hypothetical protein CETAM_09930 [Corynebacterium comes]
MTQDADAGTDLILVEGAEGILAIGSSSALEGWQASAGVGRITRIRQPENRVLALVNDLLPGAAQPAASFLQRPGVGGANAELRLMTRGANGRFTSNTPVDPTQFAKLAGGPQMIVVQAAIQAVSQELGEIREALDEVKEGVDELLRAADAERLGDVYGRHRILRRMSTDLHEGHRLTSTDWEAVASQGPILEVGTEKLRCYLVAQMETLSVDDVPRVRAKVLKRLVDTGRVGDLLKLLVTAQESLALYQRIRLERVYDREPEAVEQTVSSISRILEENLSLDTKLAEEFRRVLNQAAVLHPSEGFDLFTRRSLDTNRKALAEVVEQFLLYREAQNEDWELANHAGFKDAFGHFRDRGAEAINTGRRTAAKGLGAVVNKIEPKE